MTRYVLSKSPGAETFGNDADVVTNSDARAPFGNDDSADVVSKPPPRRRFGDYSEGAMFVRVRRRKLGGYHRDYESWEPITASTSFDVVRAVRIKGQPRQKFLFGLGSLKQPIHPWYLMHFWCGASRWMSVRRPVSLLSLLRGKVS